MRSIGLLAASVWLAAAAAITPAQPDDTKEPPRRAAKDPARADRVYAAIDRKDWPQAERLLLEQIDAGEGGFVPYYNLACVSAVTGRGDEALEWLVKSVERGFSDLHTLRRDTYLNRLRDHPGYRALIDAWPEILARRIDTDVRLAREFFGGPMHEERDEGLRIVVLSSFDEKARAQARREIALVDHWARRTLFPGMMEAPESKDDPWVTVVLPRREGFVKWSVLTYGPASLTGAGAVGGAYSHDEKRLVSQDLGATLRHEFLHVLHWRHTTRLGQRHPIYIQEGLCSLVEDFDVIPDPAGAGGPDLIVPVSSWRTNIVKRRERFGSLPTIAALASMPHERFVASSPLANYAAARTLFQWLDAQGKLGAWYAHYTANFDADPTGVRSFEHVLGVPAKDLDKAWRAWIRALPEVPEEITRGMASLGLEVEAGDGDGCRVTAIGPPEPGRLGRRPSSARGVEGEVRLGDVIRTIDGKPVREMAEMVRVLSGYRPGDTVRLEIRRGRSIEDVAFKLIAKP
ncbi:MAG: PDZ domain-containing protein [Phycisphaeraceae bacterium]|nr:MAG: PDZ domain-containing protein [Phycisphaeraceae bacterium]